MIRIAKAEKIISKPTARDYAEGIRLQKRANAMFVRGETSSDYATIRRSAEEHLGFWDWQNRVPEWRRVGITDTTNLRPRACCCVGDEKGECAYLPAGSQPCRDNDCPT